MLAALLFDLDGTLTHSDKLHLIAIQQLLQEEDGRAFTQEEFEALCSGCANPQMCQNLFPERSVAEHLAFADRKEARFRELCLHLDPLPGLGRLLDYAEQHGIGMVVVTNAPRANADHMLGALGLAARLPRVVVAEELPHAKPHPLPYLTGLQQLAAEAHVGLAFEDSVPGITAAKAAGIFTVGLATSQTVETLTQAGADLVIDDYNAPQLWALIEGMHAR